MHQDFIIRRFTNKDLPGVLNLIDLNTPLYFHASEKKDLNQYLANNREDYWVVVHEGEIVGCGGLNYFESEQKARISWDMIHPKCQNQGVGKSLLAHRINHIKSKNQFKLIEVRTSQMAHEFYAKSGFELQSIVEDYWAPGFHLYQMKMPL